MAVRDFHRLLPIALWFDSRRHPILQVNFIPLGVIGLVLLLWWLS